MSFNKLQQLIAINTSSFGYNHKSNWELQLVAVADKTDLNSATRCLTIILPYYEYSNVKA